MTDIEARRQAVRKAHDYEAKTEARLALVLALVKEIVRVAQQEYKGLLTADILQQGVLDDPDVKEES